MNGYFAENEDEIIQLILQGEAVCDCGALMNLEDDQFICILVDSEPDIPSGCVSCGGPYPSCMSACSRFDD